MVVDLLNASSNHFTEILKEWNDILQHSSLGQGQADTLGFMTQSKQDLRENTTAEKCQKPRGPQHDFSFPADLAINSDSQTLAANQAARNPVPNIYSFCIALPLG